jgi:endonuclease YncB( thermonuclease family)
MRTTLALIASVVLAQQAVAADAPCRGTPAGNGVVASVTDGRTLKLADGREVRLAGIEAGDGAALQRLVAGKTQRLERTEDKTGGIDRYGRLVAFAFLPQSHEPMQKMPISEGAARVSARAGGKYCAEDLLAAENEARRAKRGLWADPNFAPLSSENLSGLAAATGHFALVEGQVLSVRESGATIYVNFGRRWTRDFTVTILKRQKRTFAAAGLDLDRLQGRRVRVRGVIEQRRGPIIEAQAPEQIEAID